MLNEKKLNIHPVSPMNDKIHLTAMAIMMAAVMAVVVMIAFKGDCTLTEKAIECTTPHNK